MSAKEKILTNIKNPESVIWHLVFWISYLLLYTGMQDTSRITFFCAVQIAAIDIPIKVATSYLFMYWILPKTLKDQNIRFLLISLLISVPVTVYINGWIIYNYVIPLTNYYAQNVPFWTLQNIFKIFARLYGVVFIAIALRYVYLISQEQKRLREIENQQLSTEMKYLKLQLNPHFLFNTLNNLYSMILNKKKQASEIVLKLSELMNYIIYDASAQTVTMAKEIEYLRNYIDLERTRFGDRISVSFKTSGPVADIKIPPLISLPLVENCFKHGLTDEISGVMIRIDFSVFNGQVTLIVENTKSQHNIAGNTNGGIGLKNLRRRLKLLFGDDFVFKIQEDDDTFLAIVKFDSQNINDFK